MENKTKNDVFSIPYAVYEQERTRNERAHKRLWILCIILIVTLIGSNIGWIIYENQFETVTEVTEQYEYEVEQDNDGGDNNFIGHDGDITYGEAESKG